MPRVKGVTAKEIEILRKLVENGRVTFTQISRDLGMSPAGVMKKVRKLEDLGIIKGYTALVDHAKLGKGSKYIILLEVEPGKHNEVAKKIASMLEDNILEVHEITGQFDIIVKVIAGSQQELNDVLRKIQMIPGVRDTNTSLILDTTKERPSIVPSEIPGITKKGS
ncbi:Lrp/AsnC family transcriptional regulator [Candidatus Korarchaeum cryptofilum]|jgi:DNA-binding Lrp family transcriptional regulator|uniref:Transcriptional regulator, AsnC family n=1 Tax=Korarchaeum cryptofilum (strain OPF8) TaxID=374847 RepID=B1L6A7_KORCO|nr:Lrp/AsnC family transcriptional regulator [Candidatus Korarchaeum cryptofilum]ACB07986.1 transcriptional regulator, AsnC family [Candidatus Korarchaeum cryptofilum OPF8]